MERTLQRLGNEVRHTLHNIMGLLGLINEELLSDNQSQYLFRCRGSADKLLRLANDLSSLATDEARLGVVKRMPVTETVRDVAELMEVLAVRRGLKLTWSVEPGCPEIVEADCYLIQDALRRLLDNAIQFTETGTIQVKVRAELPDVDSVVLVLEVSDNGPGIPAEVLNDLETGPVVPRSGGLGLAVVKRQLTQSGGTFSIVSSDVRGTTVRLSLPVRAVSGHSASPAESTGVSDVQRSRPLNLLVAEDSNDSFLLLQVYVKVEGHRLTRALDGAQATAMAKIGDYDLILMDVNMPVMDGYTAARTIREWEVENGRSHVPILLLSADDPARQARIGAAVGCSGYLPKPTTKAEVLSALRFFATPELAKARAGTHRGVVSIR